MDIHEYLRFNNLFTVANPSYHGVLIIYLRDVLHIHTLAKKLPSSIGKGDPETEVKGQFGIHAHGHNIRTDFKAKLRALRCGSQGRHDLSVRNVCRASQRTTIVFAYHIGRGPVDGLGIHPRVFGSGAEDWLKGLLVVARDECEQMNCVFICFGSGD